MKPIKLKSGRLIGHGHPVFIIAEAGVNHNGDINIAKKLIEKAKSIGADAIKFQSFNTSEIILKNAPKAKYHVDTTGDDKYQSWFDLLKTQEISVQMHEEIINHCKNLDILFMSTPYDQTSLDTLLKFEIEILKIASTDNNNLPFLINLAKTKVPLILSTAMISQKDLDISINHILKNNEDHSLILLQCTGSYPAPLKDCNLNVIASLRYKYQLNVGYSDHVNSPIPSIVSIGLGACVIEKHFTLDQKLPGPDHKASLEPDEFQKFINDIRFAELSLGDGIKNIKKSEAQNKNKLKKFMVSKRFIKTGEIFKDENITTKRTGGIGLDPINYFEIIGKKSLIDIEEDRPIEEKMIAK